MSEKADVILEEMKQGGIRLQSYQEERCRAGIISALNKIDSRERAEKERNREWCRCRS